MLLYHVRWTQGKKPAASKEQDSNIVDNANERQDIGQQIRGQYQVEYCSTQYGLGPERDTPVSEQPPEQLRKPGQMADQFQRGQAGSYGHLCYNMPIQAVREPEANARQARAYPCD